MPDVLQRCWLRSAHRQQYVGAALYSLPAGSGVSGSVRGPLLFLAVGVVVVLAELGILCCSG